jgi:hypothetical protein
MEPGRPPGTHTTKTNSVKRGGLNQVDAWSPRRAFAENRLGFQWIISEAAYFIWDSSLLRRFTTAFHQGTPLRFTSRPARCSHPHWERWQSEMTRQSWTGAIPTHCRRAGIAKLIAGLFWRRPNSVDGTFFWKPMNFIAVGPL